MVRTRRVMGRTIGVLVSPVIRVLPPDDDLSFVLVDADVCRTLLGAAVLIEEELQRQQAYQMTTPATPQTRNAVSTHDFSVR